MKPVSFDYARPADVPSALKLTGGASAKLIAGGQSLGPMLNLRLSQPELLIDITAIDSTRRYFGSTAGVAEQVEEQQDADMAKVSVTWEHWKPCTGYRVNR